MIRNLCGRAEAVQHPFAPVPCSMFRHARRTPWRTAPRSAFVSGAADHASCCSPPPLLPAPGAASFSTNAGASDLGRLRHLATRLVQLSASRGRPRSEDHNDAAARYSDQLDALRRDARRGSKECVKCKKSFELYCFPADSGSSDGRFHYCSACKSEVRSQNNSPLGGGGHVRAVILQQCNTCGVQRLSGWYSKGPGPTWLQSKCRPCTALYSRQAKAKHQREWESQDSVTEKRCTACEKTQPVANFSKDSTRNDGLQYTCRVCDKARGAAIFAARMVRSRNQTLVVAGGTERVCIKCHVKKPWNKFQKCLHRISGVDSVCKQCRADTSKLVRLRQKLE